MGMKTILKIFISIFLLTKAYADVEFVPTETILLNSHLIVQAKIQKGNEKQFVAAITHVLYSEDEAYYPGKNLYVQNVQSVGCGEPYDIYSKDTVVLALTADGGKWRITNTEYIPEVKNGLAQLVQFCPKTYYNSSQWKTELLTLFATFELKTPQVSIPKYSYAYFESNYIKAPWVHFLYKWYNNLELSAPGYDCGANFWYYDKYEGTVLEPHSEYKKDTICAKPPYFTEEEVLDLNEVSHTIWLKHKRAFAEMGIEGKFYVSSMVAPDGTLSQSKMLRSIYPPADEDILKEVEKQLKIHPGVNRNDEPVTCEIRYAITIRIIH